VADDWEYLVLDDWPMSAIAKEDFYKGVMDGNGEATFDSKWLIHTSVMRSRPCIFLFNAPSYDNLVNSTLIDAEYWNLNTCVVRLNERLY